MDNARSSDAVNLKMKSLSAELVGGLEQIRGRIRVLKDERARILSFDVPEDVALGRVDEWVDNISKRHKEVLVTGARFARSPSRYQSPIQTTDVLFFGIFADKIRSHLKEEIRLYYAEKPSVCGVEREEDLTEIDRQIFEEELSEESLIRSSESAGIQLIRRGDADPRAVLAHDKVLP